MSAITTIRNNLNKKKKADKKSDKKNTNEDENEFYLRLMYLLSLPA